MLYCLDTLADGHGESAAMAGLMPGTATMQQRLAALGLQQVELPGGTIRGHTFHYSTMATSLVSSAQGVRPDGREGEPLFRSGSLTATYAHFYFPSAPQAIARIFGAAAYRT
jgi:cobyrinic acid a,c-diamide synthase